MGVDTALCGPTQGGSGQRPVLQGQHTALQAWGYSKDSLWCPAGSLVRAAGERNDMGAVCVQADEGRGNRRQCGTCSTS